MPIYISRGKFTTDAVKGMLAKPENKTRNTNLGVEASTLLL